MKLSQLLQPGVESLPFIDKPSDVLHIDINSCFATIEQQCNSLLRGRPVVVAAYPTGNGCILSPSIEAKKLGIKTAMSVKEAKQLCPSVLVVQAHPDAYRWVNKKLEQICCSYTPHLEVRSIDEVVLHLDGTPALKQGLPDVGQEIKQRMRQEIGQWMSASVGIGPNRWLAKQAAGLVKPDGLEELQWWNIEDCLRGLDLEDLHGISSGNARRLRASHLYKPLDMYQAPLGQLKQAFRSILGLYWMAKMHGYEVDDYQQQHRSLSHEYSLPRPARSMNELQTIIAKLCHKLGSRLSRKSLQADGVSVYLVWQGYEHWGGQMRCPTKIIGWADLEHYIWNMISKAAELPELPWVWPIRKVGVGCYDLSPIDDGQMILWSGDRRQQLRQAVFDIQADFGSRAISSARAIQDYPVKTIPDFVAFSGKSTLE